MPELTPEEKLREQIANNEHEQWMRWAKSLIEELKTLTFDHLAGCGCKTCLRIERWQRLFTPYSELTEAQKNQDRKEAEPIIALVQSYIKEAGYVQLDEDQELPKLFPAMFARGMGFPPGTYIEDIEKFMKWLKDEAGFVKIKQEK